MFYISFIALLVFYTLLGSVPTPPSMSNKVIHSLEDPIGKVISLIPSTSLGVFYRAPSTLLIINCILPPVFPKAKLLGEMSFTLSISWLNPYSDPLRFFRIYGCYQNSIESPAITAQGKLVRLFFFGVCLFFFGVVSWGGFG